MRGRLADILSAANATDIATVTKITQFVALPLGSWSRVEEGFGVLFGDDEKFEGGRSQHLRVSSLRESDVKAERKEGREIFWFGVPSTHVLRRFASQA
jgi:hypothetical protein